LAQFDSMFEVYPSRLSDVSRDNFVAKHDPMGVRQMRSPSGRCETGGHEVTKV
jgi:hypothetical protein